VAAGAVLAKSASPAGCSSTAGGVEDGPVAVGGDLAARDEDPGGVAGVPGVEDGGVARELGNLGEMVAATGDASELAAAPSAAAPSAAAAAAAADEAVVGTGVVVGVLAAAPWSSCPRPGRHR